MTNPLLTSPDLPPFSTVLSTHVEPAISRILADNRARLDALASSLRSDALGPTWGNLMRPIEDMNERLTQAWSLVRHLNAVSSSDEVRAAHNACLPELSAYWTELGQDEGLFRACQALLARPASGDLDAAQRRALEHRLLDFRLSGVDLPPAQKQRFKDLAQQLAALQSRFADNVLDATGAWKKAVRDEAELGGLPETVRELAREAGRREGRDAFLLTLDFPCFQPVMTYADSPSLRREMYIAYFTRASEQGPQAGEFDNATLMAQIVQKRYEMAQLLGFGSYAECSLARKMAKSTHEVMDFLESLVRRARPQAQRELDEVREFARERHAVNELEPWDVAYYSEQLRQERYAVSQKELRPYFPESRVLPGLFAVVERLYGIGVREVSGVDTWHPDVRVFEIIDQGGERQALFYVDLYARAKKRGGAWMDSYRGRRRVNAHVQLPVAYLTCNFSPPVGGSPSLLTHEEVITLFHEFGHGLHHMLTRVDYADVSGINGVEWDAVELPSQFMENWCWQREALGLISGHVQTGEPIPEDLYRRLSAARNFQSAMQMVRQLEFALFDFRLHRDFDPGCPRQVLEVWREVREQVAVVPVPAFHRFPNAFTHIFAGGYGAGYYSYKWAEVLSADAFSRFEDEGIFSRRCGEAFLHSVLEVGGARDALESFVEFRGREPGIEALLRHSGIEA